MAAGHSADTPPHIGIDFGTSKCVMTWYNPQTGQPEILRNAEGEDKTSSVVYYGEDGMVLVGSPALSMLDFEEERANVILSVKRDLASPQRYLVAGNPTRVDVAAAILSKLKADAETGHFHVPVSRVTLTYPVAFGAQEQDKLKEAARKAGFTDIALLEEPVAAARAYVAATPQAGHSLLVYDLGAGTLDLALLIRAGESEDFAVAMPPQGLRVGGDDFDRALYDHCDALARQQLGRSLGLNDQLNLAFLADCRKRKENLTLTKTARFVSTLYGEDDTILVFRHEVSRETFEALIAPAVEKTIRGTQALIAQAGAQGHAVGSIVLIGGSSRVPLVREHLRLALPDLPAPQQWDKMDYAVALGAALPLPAASAAAPPKAETGATAAPETKATPKTVPEAARQKIKQLLTTAHQIAGRLSEQKHKSSALFVIGQAEVDFDEYATGLKTAFTITSSISKARLLAHIAKSRFQAGDAEQGQKALATAMQAAQNIRDAKEQCYSFDTIASVMVEAGNLSAASQANERARITANSIHGDWDKQYAFSRVARILTTLGDEGGATRIALAQPVSERRYILRCIAEAQADAGRFTDALQTTDGIDDPWKDHALGHIADCMAKSGQIAGALDIAKRIEGRTSEARCKVLLGIALCQAQSGDTSAAVQNITFIHPEIKLLNNAYNACDILCQEAKIWHVLGDPAMTRRILEEAKARADDVDHAGLRGWRHVYVIVKIANLISIQEAFQKMSILSGNDKKQRALQGIVAAQGNTGDIVGAEQTLMRMEEGYDMVRALMNIVEAVYKNA